MGCRGGASGVGHPVGGGRANPGCGLRRAEFGGAGFSALCGLLFLILRARFALMEWRSLE